MRTTLRKWFWAWDFDKEETWLNEMSTLGLQLVAIGIGKYTFEQGTPGEYTVRLELLDNMPGHGESMQYIRFIEDTGAEYIGSVMRWVYFRKKTAQGIPFDLFSDIDSRIAHLKRILSLTGIVGALQLYIGFDNIEKTASGEISAAYIPGLLCLSFGLLIAYGFFRIYQKMRRLQKERVLHE